MTKSKYGVRYVHKIAPSPNDIGADIELSGLDLFNHKSLGAALRRTGTLARGGRVIDYRVEGNGKSVVVFPHVPGLTTYWHCIILFREGS